MKSELRKLSDIYQQLPSVPCHACGECCVSPTCTIVEFIYLMKYALNNFERKDLTDILLGTALIHPKYDGNLYCRFQDKSSSGCMVHNGRTMACRLFGLPVLSKLSINNMENCTKMDSSSIADVDTTVLDGWLRELTGINRTIVDFYVEPYWVAGLNIECWLAVYFDPLLTDGVWGNMKSLLRNNLDLAFIENRYRDSTNLKEKADSISLLYMLIKTGEKSEVLRLMDKIVSKYPFTGTYYLEEIDKMREMLQ